MLQIHESTIHRMFVACAVLMEAIFSYFNLKPDDCNLASTILEHKLSQLKQTLVLEGFGWNFPGSNGLLFSKIHFGSLFDFHITEKNSM